MAPVDVLEGSSGDPEATADAGPRRPCAAPYSSMYFQPDGIVRTCCTTSYQLARYQGADGPTLREIWDGVRLQQHRQALDAGDFSLGCQECALPLATGNRDQTLAHHFDRFDGPGPYDFPFVMDFAISSSCNLQCIMCNGGLSSAIRAHREHLPPLDQPYDDLFFEQLQEFLPHLRRAQFKGGEPFLSRSTQRVWDLMLELGIPGEVSVTTNGTIWNDRVARYVRELRMHPNISVDGVSVETVEAVRVGADAVAVWQNVDRFAEIVAETGVGMTLSFCLMPQNWHELGAFLLEVERREVNGNVILVNQPAQCDLMQLPSAELRAVVRGLDEEGESLRDRVPRNVGLWDGYVERLREQLRRPVELRISEGPDPLGSFSVSEGASADPEALARPLVAAADVVAVESDLLEWSGREPIVIKATDNLVQRVVAPEWSWWLEPGRWVGLALEAIPDAIAEHLGHTVDYLPEEGVDGVLCVGGSMPLDTGVIEFRSRALLCLDDETAEPEARIYLSTRSDPPLVTDGAGRAETR